MNVFCYKMSWDTGFAPNLFWGVLTLATCKPRIRHMAQPGDWIAGFTAKRLNPQQKPGEEKLIYLAKVTEKLTFAEYWQKFPEKRATKPMSENNSLHSCHKALTVKHKSTCGLGVAVKEDADYSVYGDNIYKPCNTAEKGYHSKAGKFHDSKSEKAQDLKVDSVLVCNEFYYFPEGKYAEVVKELHPTLPRDYCYSRNPEELVKYIKTCCVSADTLTELCPKPYKIKITN